MKDDQLDHIIKAKLQNLQVDQQPMDWDVLAGKLEQATSGGIANAGDQEFDQVIFDRLNQYAASGTHKEKHWLLFERQLHQLANFREKLLQYKLIEAILVSLLLLLTVELGFPTVKPTPFSQPAGANSALAENKLSSPASGEVALTSTAQANKERTSKLSTLSALKADKEDVVLLDANHQLALNQQKQSFPSNPSNLLESISPISSNKADFPGSTYTEIPTFAIDNGNKKEMLGPLAPIESSTSLLLHPGHQVAMRTEVIPMKRTSIQVSMLGGLDYNQVMTPQNDGKSINAFDRYALGYRGGLMLDMGRVNSRLRMGTGLIYTAKQYEVGYKRINGNFLRAGGLTAEALDNIELNIVNLPLFARYDVVQGKRWSIFAHAGVAMQVALQANYYVNFPDNLPQPVRIGQTPTRYSQINNRTGGVLEDGSFKENSFFTGNMGLGLERHVADRWSFFMQSRYEYSLGYFSAGLGPTQDRINTMSFESGIRVKLK